MSAKRRWLRAAGNLMLGIALGLASYYGLTSFAASRAQADLRQSVRSIPAFAASDPNELLTGGAGPMDWSAYADEDLAYWESLELGEPMGRIVIPALGLDTLVVKGADLPQLRKGPGWITWTDLPGPTGTCGISAHRSTYSGPFQHLERLKAGDTIDLYSPYRLYRYRVRETLIVRPNEVEVVASTERPTIALTACHPPWSSQFRMVVRGDLVEVRRVRNDGS